MKTQYMTIRVCQAIEREMKAGRIPDGPVWRALELAEYNPDTGQTTLDGVTFHVEFPPTHDVVKP